jgi:hypothetical protein
VNLINHNLYGVEISAFKNIIFFWDFFENFSILEVEIGRNGPGILGVKGMCYSKKTFFITYLIDHFTHTIIKKILLHVPTNATTTRLEGLG